jgi:hypothetical protein
MNRKKPDQVVYNDETGTYDAALKPYGTDLGAPAIELPNQLTWKHAHVREANSQLKAAFDELRLAYNKLKKKAELNQLVYAARISFTPVVGKMYHLYRNKRNEAFLSILTPEECNFNHLGSFRLTADKIWEEVPGKK